MNGTTSRPSRVVKRLALLAVAALTGFGFASVGAVGASMAGTGLSASNTISAHLISTSGWTITKSADPTSQTVDVGTTASVTYTITATKTTTGTLGASFDGQTCVTNTGAVATQHLAIFESLTEPPSSTVLDSVTVNVSAMPALAPSASHCYAYQVVVPSGAIVPGASYKDTAHVTITNYSGNLGSPTGPSPAATAKLPTTAQSVNASITVADSDSAFGPFTFSGTGSQSYAENFPCNSADGPHTITHDNTATIQSTGQHATAHVTVDCGYHPSISSQLSASSITPGGEIFDTATISGARPDTQSLPEYVKVNFTVYRGSDASACVPANIVASESGNFAQSTLNGTWFSDSSLDQLVGTWPVGTYEMQVTYDGDTDNAPAATACGDEPFTVTSS